MNGPERFDAERDLGAYDVSIKVPEHPDDRRVRLNKDLTTYRVALALIVALCALAAWVMLTTASADDRRWAQSVVTLLVGGVVGYAFRA